MKKHIRFVYAALLVLVLCACASSNTGNDIRVKCPACGYEFDIDSNG